MRLIHWLISRLGVTDPVAHAFIGRSDAVHVAILGILSVLCLAALLYARRHQYLALTKYLYGINLSMAALALGFVITDLPRVPVAKAAAVRRILADSTHRVTWEADGTVTLTVRRTNTPRSAQLFGTTVVQAVPPGDSVEGVSLTFEEATRVTDALATGRHPGDRVLVASLATR